MPLMFLCTVLDLSTLLCQPFSGRQTNRSLLCCLAIAVCRLWIVLPCLGIVLPCLGIVLPCLGIVLPCLGIVLCTTYH